MLNNLVHSDLSFLYCTSPCLLSLIWAGIKNDIKSVKSLTVYINKHVFHLNNYTIIFYFLSKMTRGYSLEHDLRLLINNPKYSDLEILCEGEKKLYGCKAILAARSEVFDNLLYNGMKESYENKFLFQKLILPEWKLY